MNVNDIVEGTQVTLHVKVGSEQVDLEVEVPFLTMNERKLVDAFMQKNNVSGILLDVVRRGGQIVSLSNENYKITASVVMDSKHHSFDVSEIRTIKLSDTAVYYFVQFKQNEAKQDNRRESFRVDVMVKGTMNQIGSKEVVPIIVRDLSATGAGLIVDSKIEPVLKRRYTVQFTSESEERFEFNVKVVRMVDLGKGRTLLGCALTTKSRSMERYLARIQLRNREKR